MSDGVRTCSCPRAETTAPPRNPVAPVIKTFTAVLAGAPAHERGMRPTVDRAPLRSSAASAHSAERSALLAHSEDALHAMRVCLEASRGAAGTPRHGQWPDRRACA